eukprot:scaffold1806_cov240-Pinguiococcus_pyrenoidosus.AAC.4
MTEATLLAWSAKSASPSFFCCAGASAEAEPASLAGARSSEGRADVPEARRRSLSFLCCFAWVPLPIVRAERHRVAGSILARRVRYAHLPFFLFLLALHAGHGQDAVGHRRHRVRMLALRVDLDAQEGHELPGLVARVLDHQTQRFPVAFVCQEALFEEAFSPSLEVAQVGHELGLLAPRAQLEALRRRRRGGRVIGAGRRLGRRRYRS